MWTRTHLITIRACAGDPGPDSTHGFIKMTVLSCWWSPPANKGWRDPRVSESPVQNQLALFLDLSSLCLLLGEYWCVYVWVCDGLNPITNSFYGGNFLQGDSIRPLYIEAKCTDVTVKEISNSAHTHTLTVQRCNTQIQQTGCQSPNAECLSSEEFCRRVNPTKCRSGPIYCYTNTVMHTCFCNPWGRIENVFWGMDAGIDFLPRRNVARSYRCHNWIISTIEALTQL